MVFYAQYDFFFANLWWLVIILILVLSGILILLDRFVFTKKEATGPKKTASRSEYFEALGGEDNYIDSKRVGSRIVVYLRDYAKLNKETIKKAGVTGFIEKSNQLTLVVKDNAKDVYDKIFKS